MRAAHPPTTTITTATKPLTKLAIEESDELNCRLQKVSLTAQLEDALDLPNKDERLQKVAALLVIIASNKSAAAECFEASKPTCRMTRITFRNVPVRCWLDGKPTKIAFLLNVCTTDSVSVVKDRAMILFTFKYNEENPVALDSCRIKLDELALLKKAKKPNSNGYLDVDGVMVCTLQVQAADGWQRL